MKEVSDILVEYNNINLVRDNKDKSLLITIHINAKKIIKFKLYSDYPYCRPLVLINDKEYIDELQIAYPRFLDEIKLNNIKCFCCNSMLCHWKPTIKLLSIIDEYKTNQSKIKQIIINSYIRRICYENNVFVPDIISSIISFCDNYSRLY